MSALRALLAALRPEEGSTEAATYVGLALLAVGFLVAGLAPLAFIVPGAVVTFIGIVPAIVAVRGRG